MIGDLIPPLRLSRIVRGLPHTRRLAGFHDALRELHEPLGAVVGSAPGGVAGDQRAGRHDPAADHGGARRDAARPLRHRARLASAAGIAPPAPFHVLRHTYASRLAMRGTPMPVIAAQLGHADTCMTERHYAHLAPSYVSETARNGLGVLGIASPREEMPLTAARGGA
jgi:integrase